MTPTDGRLGSDWPPWPVLLVAGLLVVGLLAFAGAYGFHGDEMYFVVAGQHPAFGYVDQPPLTPLLSAASVALLGVSPTAVRVLPAIEMGSDRGPDRAHRARPRWVAAGADPRRDHGGPVGLSGRRSSRHHDRSRPARLGDHHLAAREAPGGRRSAPLAGAGRHDRDRAREQGHAPVPRRGAGGRARPHPPLGCHPLALVVGGDRDRPPHLGPEPRLAGGERLAAAHDGPSDQRIRGRQPRAGRAAPLAVHRTAALPGERRRSGLGALLEGCCTVAGDRDRRTRRARPRLRQRRQGLLRHRQRAAVHGRRRDRHRPLAGPRSCPHQGGGASPPPRCSRAR